MDIQKIQNIFYDWFHKKIDNYLKKNNKKIYFREKEIWWAALGKNVGYEMDGKHELFERPVLIIKKYSKDMCFVLPLSTQIKDPLPWHQINISIFQKKNIVKITQGRSLSKKRLLRKMTILEKKEYNNIIEKFKKQFVQLK